MWTYEICDMPVETYFVLGRYTAIEQKHVGKYISQNYSSLSKDNVIKNIGFDVLETKGKNTFFDQNIFQKLKELKLPEFIDLDTSRGEPAFIAAMGAVICSKHDGGEEVFKEFAEEAFVCENIDQLVDVFNKYFRFFLSIVRHK